MRRNPDADNPFADFFSYADDEPYGYEGGDGSSVHAVFDEEDDQARVSQVLGGSQPSLAQDLVRESLVGGLRASQARYAELGQALSEKGLDRSTRTLYREARRILERAWGLDAVRVAPAREVNYARVSVPSQIQDTQAGPVFPRFAVHRFGTKETLVPREGRKERLALGQTYYGFDAISSAVKEYRSDMRNQIAEQEAKIQKLKGSRGGPTVDRKRLRAQRKRERLQAELAAFEKDVQQLHSPPEPSAAPASPQPEHLAPVPGSAPARQRERNELPPRLSPREVSELAQQAIKRNKNIEMVYVSRDNTRNHIKVEPERLAVNQQDQQVLVAKNTETGQRLSYQISQIERAKIIRR